MPQRADGQRINELIDELAQREGKRITFAEVCRRTEDLGDGFVAIEERTLNRARNDKRVDEAYLKSLAEVLGVGLPDLVKSDAQEFDRASPGVDPGSNYQNSEAHGDNSESYVAAPNAQISVNKQIYKPDG